MNKILVDTNILVYAIDEDSQFYSKSQRLLFDSNFDLYTTAKNLSEFLAVVARPSVAALSIDDVLNVVNDFFEISTILYPSRKSFSIFQGLLKRYKPTGVKIHDFEIAAIGMANGIYQIATFNVKDFKEMEEIKIINI